MAGIAGWIAPAHRAGDENALGSMAGALAHRAQAGETLSGVLDANGERQLVLAATLNDAASGISLVLDGSIANQRELRAQLAKRGHLFTGESLEELLLRAYQDWDKDVVKHLCGAFAFALWDAGKDRLLIARDRFGEKPLYLHERNGALYFASEIKALLRAGIEAKADPAAIWDCLSLRHVPGPRTLFAGIRKLAPASYGLWQFGKLREVRYWSAPDRRRQVENATSQEPVEGFLRSLEEALKPHAESGIFLSGGIDSAVLAALMSRSGAKPHSFSLGLEGDKKSELPHAAALAKHLGTAHHEVVIAPRELLSSLPKVVAYCDSPLSRPSELAVHRLATEAARVTKTVVTGDGCDEVLGGYRRYIIEGNHLPERLFAPLVSRQRSGTAAALLKRNDANRARSPMRSAEPQPRDNSRLRRAMYLDQTRWLPDQLLERTECATRSASLQAAMPFLDHRLAEYVSALPDAQRVRGLTTKWILREAAKRVIPEELRRRPKAGWRVDATGWLANELHDFTLEHLQGASSVTRQYYDAVALDRVLGDHRKGKKNHETLLWTLLNLEIWHRTYSPG
jgi:asparagine synthase (glutamine-hydrolysing)